MIMKMKRDVGMACKKVHRQGRIKVIVNILHRESTDSLIITCVIIMSLIKLPKKWSGQTRLARPAPTPMIMYKSP